MHKYKIRKNSWNKEFENQQSIPLNNGEKLGVIGSPISWCAASTLWRPSSYEAKTNRVLSPYSLQHRVQHQLCYFHVEIKHLAIPKYSEQM